MRATRSAYSHRAAPELIEESRRLKQQAAEALERCREALEELNYVRTQITLGRFLGTDPNSAAFIRDLDRACVKRAIH